jgi:hypothetical protein
MPTYHTRCGRCMWVTEEFGSIPCSCHCKVAWLRGGSGGGCYCLTRFPLRFDAPSARGVGGEQAAQIWQQR